LWAPPLPSPTRQYLQPLKARGKGLSLVLSSSLTERERHLVDDPPRDSAGSSHCRGNLSPSSPSPLPNLAHRPWKATWVSDPVIPTRESVGSGTLAERVMPRERNHALWSASSRSAILLRISRSHSLAHTLSCLSLSRRPRGEAGGGRGVVVRSATGAARPKPPLPPHGTCHSPPPPPPLALLKPGAHSQTRAHRKKIHIHIPLAAAVACSYLLHAPALDAQSTSIGGGEWNGGAGVDPLAAAASAASSSPLDAGSALALSYQFISTHCFSFSRRLSGPI
jgi:hypothetical protein